MHLAHVDDALDVHPVDRWQIARVAAIAAVTIVVLVAIVVVGSAQANRGATLAGSDAGTTTASTDTTGDDVPAASDAPTGALAVLEARRATAPVQEQPLSTTVLVTLGSIAAVTGFGLLVRRSRRTSSY